nr:MAG TPA: hypothetical protein [Caudoviricetes sp.]DAY41994.1 MAG TPA: hypothetical protein [Caudoviricetes sp.]
MAYQSRFDNVPIKIHIGINIENIIIIFPINPNPEQIRNIIAARIIQGRAVTKAIIAAGIEATKIVNIIKIFEIISLFFFIMTHLF